MGTSVSVEVIGLPALAARLDPARLRALIVPALTEAGTMMATSAQEKTPRDTGTLQGSIKPQVDEAALAVHVGTNVRYATYVHGFMDSTATRSKPHFVPLAALAGWAGRHGTTPGAVSRAIAMSGTPLVPFLRNARDETRDEVRAILNAAVRAFTGGA